MYGYSDWGSYDDYNHLGACADFLGLYKYSDFYGCRDARMYNRDGKIHYVGGVMDYQKQVDDAIFGFLSRVEAIADDCYREIIAPYFEANNLQWDGQDVYRENGRIVRDKPDDVARVFDLVYTLEEWDTEGNTYNRISDFWPTSENTGGTPENMQEFILEKLQNRSRDFKKLRLSVWFEFNGGFSNEEYLENIIKPLELSGKIICVGDEVYRPC